MPGEVRVDIEGESGLGRTRVKSGVIQGGKAILLCRE